MDRERIAPQRRTAGLSKLGHPAESRDTRHTGRHAGVLAVRCATLKRLVAASALAVLMVAALGSASCRSKAERQEYHLVRAQQYFDDGKYPEAGIEFRNALQIDPKSAVAHFKLGKTYLALND